jgi:FkbM family methyltransferase
MGKMDYSKFLKKLGLRKSENLPRVVNIQKIIPEGIRFEISTPVEVFRIEEFGGEEEFTRLILGELRPLDVLYDMGTCVGFVSLHAAKKGVHVISFEPDPYYRKRLENNIRLNGLEKNIKIINWAVSDSEGEVILYTDGVEGLSPSLRQKGSRGTVNVKTDTIDNALKRGEIPVPDVVKMDIEGAEILALRGMKGLFGSEKRPRTIFLEIHPDFLVDFNSSTEEVNEILIKAGYVQEQKNIRLNQFHCIYRKK